MKRFKHLKWMVGAAIAVTAGCGGMTVQTDFDPAVGTTMWATFSYTATAGDAGDTLRLIAKGVPDATWGGKIGLDDVSVRVPLPPQRTLFVIR